MSEIASSPTVIVVGNNKGGVGKTFISKNLADYCAIVLKKRVLLLDLDPQTNLSARYLKMELSTGDGADFTPPKHPDWEEGDPDWNGYSDTSQIWYNGMVYPYPTAIENLDILPADAKNLQSIEMIHEEDMMEKVVNHFKSWIALPELAAAYDFIIIDTRPSKGPLVQSAMHAATHLLIPTEMKAPSVEGLQGMLSTRNLVNAYRRTDAQLQLIGILPNKIKSSAASDKEFIAALSEDTTIGPFLFKHFLSDWVGYSDSMVAGNHSIFSLPASDKHRIQMTAACNEVFERMGAL
jgi:chromosome partitioning protein